MSETNDTTRGATTASTTGTGLSTATVNSAGLVFGQVPQTQVQPVQPEPQKVDGKDVLPEWAQKELEKARSESAERRVKLRELEAQLKEFAPLAERAKQEEEARKTESDKLREQLDALKADQLKAQAAAETAVKEKRLILLATKAGVDPDVVLLLDLSKLDLDDEEATITTLKKLAPARISGGGPSNPSGGQNGAVTEGDLRNMYFGGGRGPKNLMFGGNK